MHRLRLWDGSLLTLYTLCLSFSVAIYKSFFLEYSSAISKLKKLFYTHLIPGTSTVCKLLEIDRNE